MSRGRGEEVLFGFFWRITILCLPWQTRWFHEAFLVGWPWEQGRMSVYISWFPLIAAVIVGAWIERDSWKQTWNCREMKLLGVCILSTILATHVDHITLRPVVQWWVQIVLLAVFASVLWRRRVSAPAIATWFVISLLPHVLLGWWQQAHQVVIGSKWFGMATQLPQTPGVAVIEYAGQRILRLYGGFPHPNIFGGWLASALIVLFWLAGRPSTKWHLAVWSAMAAMFSATLFLTYARGAWLAAIIGTVYLVGARFIAPSDRSDRSNPIRSNPLPSEGPMHEGVMNHAPTRIMIAVLISVVTTLCVAFPHRHLLLSRFDTTNRLEQRSITERSGSLRDGVTMFRRHWLFGTGPNAELIDLARGLNTERASAPLQPPHNVFLLALIDMGLLGICLMFFFVRKYIHIRGRMACAATAVFLTLAILGLFDHYLWSTWSGQTLVIMAILLIRDEA